MAKKLLLLLLLMFAWQQGQASPMPSTEELNDGDVFTALSPEGVEMTFKVISAAEKTCQVGTGNNGDATIDKSYNGPITIPASANGYKVTKVASWAFYYYRYITSITVSEGIEQFMSNSIESCYGITEFIVPASVTQISESFGGVGPLTSLSVASGNTVYDSRDNCNAIIETASNTLMVGCVNTVIPESVTAIGGWSFYYAGLQSLKIPEKVTSIGNGAFRGNNFKELVIPASVRNIGWGAFDYCHSLEKVTILPIECTIGYNAFADCSNLKEVTSYIRNPQAATSAIFYTEYGDDGAIINDNVTLHVTYGSKSRYETTEGWNNFKKIQETIHVANSSSLSVPNLKIAANGTNDLMIGVDNPLQGISKVEFDMYLPTGLSIAMKDGKLVVEIAGRTTAANHTIETSENNGVVHVKMSSASDALIEGVSGALLRIPLTADETFAGGEIQLKQQVLSSPDETESRPEDLTVAVEQDKIITFADETVKTICVKNWDTNGDGELSEAEAAAVTSLGEDIFTRANISTFHELKYFTGLKSIGFNAFHGSKIKEVTLPETITSIGMCAFSESPLTSINFPSGLTSIGYEAFYECGLTSIDLPSSLTTINDRAFMYCDLNSVVIPAKVTYIGNDAFSGLKEITSLITNPTDIKEYAFDCYTSAALNVPSGTKALYKEAVGWKNFYFIAEPGENLFFEVDGIRYGKMGTNRVCLIDGKNASGDYTIPYGFSYEGVWYQVKAISAGAFANNEALISIVSGIYMEEIGDNAFSGCTALKSISIGRYVKSIGTGIIGNCSALESVMSAIEEPFHVSSSTFSPWLYGSSNYKLYVPFGTTSLYQEAGWMSDASRIVEGYDGETFTAETEGENVMTFEVLSATDKTCAVVRRGIDSNTFVKRKSSDVVIPSEVNGFKVVSIKGEDVFCWVNLNSLTIPASITSIGYYSFNPRGDKTHIGTIHISDLKAWCNIDFGDNPLSYSDHLFLNGEEVKDLVIPDDVTSLGKKDDMTCPSPFADCKSLTSVTIHKALTDVGYSGGFNGCPNISSMVVEEGNPVYDSRNNCNAIIETASDMLVSGCKNTVIPDGIKTISDFAFQGCSGLTSIAIPSSVTSMGFSSFWGCNNLTSVTVFSEEPIACSISPFTNSANATLYVPKGSREAYKAADGWKDFKEIVEVVFGDADGDGDVDPEDVELVVDYIMNGNAEGINLISADANGNKVLNVVDIVKMINAIKNR